jgi:MFS transporter, YNFM family, putative membrane transport protein
VLVDGRFGRTISFENCHEINAPSSPTQHAFATWPAAHETWPRPARFRYSRSFAAFTPYAVDFIAFGPLSATTPTPNRTVLAPSPSIPVPSQTRAIVLLAVAGFASQAMVRAADTLLPQIATDFSVTVGAASIVVSTYAVMHGSMQLISGPVGDRLGKYRMIAIATALCAVLVFCCGLTSSLAWLTVARLATGMSAAWIIPLGMAYIGDVVPYDRRQQVLGRYLSGQIIGQLFGQAAGGIIGDALGWRAVFFVLAGMFAVAALGLFHELRVNPLTRPLPKSEAGPEGAATRSVLADYRRILETPWARIMLLAVFFEGAFMFGAFAYVGADLHQRFGLSFTLVGVVIAAFGLGGLVYAGFVRQLFGRFGEIGLAAYGGTTLGIAYLMLAFAPAWWAAPLAVAMIGLGYYMLHNTLQTNATQMAPEARATGVCMFSAALYLGQPAGVAVVAPVIDRFGAPPVFFLAGILLPALGLWFAGRLAVHKTS